MDYKKSGVDVAAGERAVRNIKSLVKTTYNQNVLTELGSFGGLYKLDLRSWKEPIMVSSTDGVGTKILVARMANEYGTIGQDLVNHCVNDIFVQGAIPQYFLDYIGLSGIDEGFIQKIIEGMVKACVENGVCLIGGEMAEMPDIYQKGDFDLVGTIVGLVESSNLITGERICEDDVIIGFPSTGLHTNGYTLARKIVFEMLKLDADEYVGELKTTVKEALLAVHRSYYPLLKKWANPEMIHGMAHITGGGLKGNIKRIMPSGLSAVIDSGSWEVPALFRWLVESGNVPKEDSYSAFNMGIGFVVITSREKSEEILQGTDGFLIGRIIKRENVEDVQIFF